MEFIIFAIIALIGGYFFVKKYSKMDVALFGSIEGYNPSGIYLVYSSTVIGAIFGCLSVYKKMFDDSLNNDVMGVVIFTVMSLLLCVSIYHSILVFDSVGAMVAKSLWMIFSCALSAVIGFVGSVVVITVVVLFLFIKIMLKVALEVDTSSSSSGGKKIYGEIEAKVLHLTHLHDDIYRSADGKHYRKNPTGGFEELP